MRTFWSLLVAATALPGEGQIYAPGSKVYAQCFVPVMRLEDALPALDAFLTREHFQRTDIRSAYRFDLDDPDEEYSLEVVRREGQEAVETGVPRIGWFVSSRESAHLFGDSDA